MVRSVFDITVDFEKSHGSYLYDKKTEAYFFDMFSMFSSLPLGYNHKIFSKEFDEKIKYISHLKMCNNLFHSDEIESFERKFLEIAFQPNLHFTSTGALAVESAFKCAYEYTRDPGTMVVGTSHSFHGINSWGVATDRKLSSVRDRVINYPKHNWENVPLEDLGNFLDQNSSKISSCIVEPIQCTAGDLYLDPIELRKVQEICKKNDICFIVDEVQTGFGVTGNFWYSNKIELKPDILIFGKKSQISGIMTNNKYSEAIKSKHRKLEVTFDGDLIDACRSEYILKAIKKYSLLEKVSRNCKKLRDEISESFLNYRSEGHLIAFDFLSKEKRDGFVKRAYDNKLLVNPTSEKTVRLRPNLAISEEEIEDFLIKIKKSI